MLLREQISVEIYAGAGAHGDRWRAAEPRRAYVEPKHRIVATEAGGEVVSEAIAYVRGDDVTVDSRIGWKGRRFRVLSAVPLPLNAGTELMLGSAS
jgi:head-tail adaptor